MRIALLSTAIEEKLFASLNEQGKAPNPSGQNFYLRLFSALERAGEVEAFSLVGFASSLKGNDERFRYLYPPKGKLARMGYAKKIASEVLASDEANHFGVLFYDSLNLTIAKAARLIAKTKRIKVIAVCTDDPSNISFAPKYYAGLCLRYNASADGYFCLTKGLNELFNRSNKPSYIQIGIVEKQKTSKPLYEKPYIYFGGALFEKDGVTDLVNAFLSVKPPVDLLISGHGPLANELASKNENSLHFLGQISKEDHLNYVAHAVAAINPRRYNSALDKVSVPSKVLEYIALAPVVVSSLSTPIKEAYGENVLWLDPSKDNREAIEDFLRGIAESTPKSNHAQDQIVEDLGFEKTGAKLSSFLGVII